MSKENCSEYLRKTNQPVPRTCKICKLGKCTMKITETPIKKSKKVKVWTLTLNGDGYFSEHPEDFLQNIKDLGIGEKFVIECIMLDRKTINDSAEFGGF